ncbi:RHS repeat-associated core domain-containing protein [Pseudomonas sp. LM20]|uniref:RHS repeat-associated core domain-containing protein n=1 Tax=unclassified Pseudomonas TaxID=196821 RepID=UPI001F21AC44|nr:RHS repeat-associated core domain-containing protein [Pseudomonas sp. LM20]MCE5990320.1 RHS repeat-associated core domain-containing protein [Pseudomonas sp. LM20]
MMASIILDITAMNGFLQKYTGNLLFYSGRELVCQTGKEMARLLYASSQLLVQQSEDLKLLQTAGNNTVIASWGRGGGERATYSPYGFSLLEQVLALAGFNGQWRDPVGGGYPLGLGKRFFSVTLTRFCSPDTESPFGRGGLGSYNYCSGDPVNFHDPSGCFRWPWQSIKGVKSAMDRAGLKAPELKHLIKAAIKEDPQLEGGLYFQVERPFGAMEVTLQKGKGTAGAAVIKWGAGRYHMKTEYGDLPDAANNPRLHSTGQGVFASDNKAIVTSIYRKAAFIRGPRADY